MAVDPDVVLELDDLEALVLADRVVHECGSGLIRSVQADDAGPVSDRLFRHRSQLTFQQFRVGSVHGEHDGAG
jgi:hypothetical protein